jgi:hypothetical protein
MFSVHNVEAVMIVGTVPQKDEGLLCKELAKVFIAPRPLSSAYSRCVLDTWEVQHALTGYILDNHIYISVCQQTFLFQPLLRPFWYSGNCKPFLYH